MSEVWKANLELIMALHAPEKFMRSKATSPPALIK